MAEVPSFPGGRRCIDRSALEHDGGPGGLGSSRGMGHLRGRCGRSINKLLASKNLCIPVCQSASAYRVALSGISGRFLAGESDTVLGFISLGRNKHRLRSVGDYLDGLPDELSGSAEGFLMNLSRLSSNGPVLSIVIPVFNEKSVLPRLYERLHKVLHSLDCRCEVVFVDDGSSDGSTTYLAGLAYTYPWIRLIKLSRNFGKEAATTAGLDHALGRAVIIMDADLQDPPELIPVMVEAWRSGIDVVLMQRRSRNGEDFLKRFCAYAFYRLLSRLSDVTIPKDVGDFRLMSRRAIDALGRLRERNRYMKGLFAWIGLPTKVIPFDREPRAAGDSKWNFIGLMRLAMEGLTSFSVSPLRCVTFLGLLTALGSAMYGVLIVAKTVIIGSDVSGYPSLMAVMTFIGGIQLLSIGLVGEYVGRIYLESKQRPIYLVEEVCELPQDEIRLARSEER
mgnify:CR=1 FL=1